MRICRSCICGSPNVPPISLGNCHKALLSSNLSRGKYNGAITSKMPRSCGSKHKMIVSFLYCSKKRRIVPKIKCFFVRSIKVYFLYLFIYFIYLVQCALRYRVENFFVLNWQRRLQSILFQLPWLYIGCFCKLTKFHLAVSFYYHSKWLFAFIRQFESFQRVTKPFFWL